MRVIEVDGAPALSVAIRDVTERRERAAALREAGERFKRLFEDGPVAMALAGDDFVLAEVNAAFCKLTGYSPEELSGLTFNDISHPDDRDVGLRLAQTTFTGEIPGFKLDKRYLRKDGEVVWVEVSVSVDPRRGGAADQDARRDAVTSPSAAWRSLTPTTSWTALRANATASSSSPGRGSTTSAKTDASPSPIPQPRRCWAGPSRG